MFFLFHASLPPALGEVGANEAGGGQGEEVGKSQSNVHLTPGSSGWVVRSRAGCWYTEKEITGSFHEEPGGSTGLS